MQNSVKRYYEIKNIIIEQYTECTKALNKLFEIAPDISYLEDGVGKCFISKDNSSSGIVGPVKILLLQMREDKLKAHPNSNLLGVNNVCPFHELNKGCILDELKSPLCVAYYEKGKLSEIYDWKYVQNILIKILKSSFDDKLNDFLPEQNWVLVKELKDYINKMINILNK